MLDPVVPVAPATFSYGVEIDCLIIGLYVFDSKWKATGSLGDSPVRRLFDLPSLDWEINYFVFYKINKHTNMFQFVLFISRWQLNSATITRQPRLSFCYIVRQLQ